MSIDSAGFVSSNGLIVLVTQGVTGGRLVAGKECLLRVHLSQSQVGNVDRVICSVKRPSPLREIAIVATSAYLTTEMAAPHGPSVGFILRGYTFPRSGDYDVELWLYDAGGRVLVTCTVTLSFAPTFDLRLVIVPVQGSNRGFLPTQAWYDDIDSAMLRLGSIMPVRDCVQKHLGEPRNQGIRYHVAQPKEAWPEEVGLPPAKPPYPYYGQETRAIDAAAGPNDDHVDSTSTYRPVQNGEGPGGDASYCGQPRFATTVSGGRMTAPVFGQEIGHTLCLEPSTSPSYDGGMHSKDQFISDPLAYDFINRRPYPPGLGDLMGPGAWAGADSVHYSVYDWNYLLTQSLPTLGSTGSDRDPAVYNPCGSDFDPRERALPPPEWHYIIGDFVHGGYIWGPHGPEPVPPWARQRTPAAITSLLGDLDRLQEAGVSEVYLPTADKHISIAVDFAPFSCTAGQSRVL